MIPLTSGAPNLAGDDVRFARYVDGKPVNWGHMHRDEIKKFQDQGQDIRIVDASWQPPAVQLDPIPQLQFTIAQVLDQTDKYFTGDALDNIDAPTQAKWRQYRRALRDAAKKGTVQDIVAAAPAADPKGNDPFQKFR